MNKKRRYCAAALLMVMLCAILSLTASACKKKPEQGVEGPETGIYYFDAEAEEYIITLNSVNKFAFMVDGVNKSGEYALDGETLTLIFGEQDELAATLKDNTISLTYEGTEYIFLKKVNYTVTFDSNGGSGVDSAAVVNGKTVSKPADPVKDGYAFMGWYSDSGLTEEYQFGSQPVSADITLYAKWAKVVNGQTEFVISFELGYDGAENPASIQTVGGQAYGIPEPEARSGYNFKGWWISMCNDGALLSYPYSEDIVFGENTTLFALWQPAATTSKLAEPVVTVSSGMISWDGITGASKYKLEVSGPNGFTAISEELSLTSKSINFAAEPAGDYTIRVTAIASSESNNSQTAVRFYKNKALNRVSHFEVAQPSVLVFNSVPDAEKYLITVDCGDKRHNHTLLDNGSSTSFDFSNCAMQEQGIKFIVTAVADGYAQSQSDEFVYNRVLDKISSLYLDEATETLSWDSVPQAAGYMVSVNGGAYVNIGNITNFSLKQLSPKDGGIEVKVYPVTKGYNSPEAAEIKYNKTRLAAPADIRISGNTLSWGEVEGATSYEISIGGVSVTSDTNELDLTDSRFNWAVLDYTLTIKANGASESKNSLWSDGLDIRYYAMYATLGYNKGVLSWRHVVGAESYEIKVNNGQTLKVTDGVNFAEITLTRAGINTVSVRFVEANGDASPWVETEIYAYTVILDSRGGNSVSPLFKAIGDKIELPEAEKDGFIFVGWYNTAGGPENNSARYDEDTFTGPNDIYLYAYYEAKSYTVTFDYCGGTGSETSALIKFNSEYWFPVPVNADTTKAFGGWYSLSGGRGSRFTDETGKSIALWPFAADTTVYAYWIDLVLDYKLTTLPNSSEQVYEVSQGAEIGNQESITIPQTYNDLRVAIIAGFAFSGCKNLVEINIPDTIELISSSTPFDGCVNLAAVNIISTGSKNVRYWSDNGVVYDYGAVDEQPDDKSQIKSTLVYFPAAKTGEYKIPDGVATVPAAVFANSKLSAITIPASVTHIGSGAFSNSSELTSIVFAAPRAGETVQPLVIAERAFGYCTKLNAITLPARLESIPLTRYSIGSNEYVSSWEGNEGVTEAFYGCTKLVSISVENGGTNYSSDDGMLYNADKTIIYYCPAARTAEVVVPRNVVSIANGAFFNCTNIQSVTISVTVTEIGECAFYGCVGLSSLTYKGGTVLLNPAMIIGVYAFRECTALSEIIFENNSNVSVISKGAFYECKAIEELTLLSTVTVIEDNAFNNCTALTSLTFEDGKTGNSLSFGNNLFLGCSNLSYVYLPYQANGIPDFEGCTSLVSPVINPENPNFTKDADGVVFNNDKTMLVYYPQTLQGAYVIPETVTVISGNAFKDCKSLTEITIGKNVQIIGDSAFSGCTALEKVIFENGSKELIIGSNAFDGCRALKEVAIPARTATLGSYAFSSSGLESVTFESGIQLETIGAYSFSGTRITEIVIPASVVTIDSGAFSGATNLSSVTYESGTKLQTIGAYSFYGCRSVIEITIPNTVTLIGPHAFSGDSRGTPNNLSNVIFQDGGTQPLSIGGYSEKVDSYGWTFSNCAYLTQINFPSRLAEIGAYSFIYCSALESVNFGTDSNLKYIGTGAFESCTSLVDIVIPNSVYNQVTIVSGSYTISRLALGKEAFSGCVNLEAVIFEEGNTNAVSIGEYAFSGCVKLKDLTLPAGFVAFEGEMDNTFNSCSMLSAINIEEGNEYYASFDGLLYSNDYKQLILCPVGKTDIELHDDIEEVLNGAFSGCTKITTITIPGTMPDYDVGIFADCTSLTSIIIKQVEGKDSIYETDDKGVIFNVGKTVLISGPVLLTGEYEIPASVTEIAANAFKGSKVTSITFASGSDQDLIINDYAFAGSQISSIALPARLVNLGCNVFENCANLTTVTFEQNSRIEELPNYTFYNCSALQQITIPASVIVISDAAAVEGASTTFHYGLFYGCSSLTTVKFATGSKLEKIGSYAFSDLPIESITFPSSLKEIGGYAFYNCKSLKSITFPANLNSIGNSAFEYCTEIYGGVTIPASVTQLGDSVFRSCEKITRATVNAKVEKLDDNFFRACSALTTVTLNNGIKELGEMVFIYCEKLTTITLPDGLELFGDYCFRGTAITSFTVPSTVTTLPYGVFGNCTNLQTVVLHDNITSIASGAFSGCTALTEINLPNNSSFTAIPANMFSGCTSIVSITIPRYVSEIGGGAFYGSSITTFAVHPENTYFTVQDGILLNYEKTVIISVPANKSGSYTVNEGVTVYPYAFAGSKVTSVTISDGVTLGDYSFSGSAIKTLALNGSVQIGNYAFNNCTSLTGITVSASATSVGIGNYAFRYCTALTNLTVENDKLTLTISATAFSDAGLKDLDLTVKSVVFEDNDSDYFRASSQLESVKISAESVYIGNYVFYNNTSLTSFELTSTSPVVIGNYSFRYCSNLNSFTLNADVGSVGSFAFGDCTSIESIYISDKVTFMGNYVFKNWTEEQTIYIAVSETVAGSWSYYWKSDCNAEIVYDYVKD